MIGDRSISVLMIDDDDVDVHCIERCVARTSIDCTLYRAHDGLEAMEMLLRGDVPSPYLILLDLNMPRMGGVEFLENLRKHPDLHNSVVIVLTTSNDQKDKLRAFEFNVAGYIIKESLDEGFKKLTEFIEFYCELSELPMIRVAS